MRRCRVSSISTVGCSGSIRRPARLVGRTISPSGWRRRCRAPELRSDGARWRRSGRTGSCTAPEPQAGNQEQNGEDSPPDHRGSVAKSEESLRVRRLETARNVVASGSHDRRQHRSKRCRTSPWLPTCCRLLRVDEGIRRWDALPQTPHRRPAHGQSSPLGGVRRADGDSGGMAARHAEASSADGGKKGRSSG